MQMSANASYCKLENTYSQCNHPISAGMTFKQNLKGLQMRCSPDNLKATAQKCGSAQCLKHGSQLSALLRRLVGVRTILHAALLGASNIASSITNNPN